MRQNEAVMEFGPLDLCVEIDNLVGCDINFDEEYRVITLDKKEIFHGSTKECQKVLAGMYIMAMYIKDNFAELVNSIKGVNKCD